MGSEGLFQEHRPSDFALADMEQPLVCSESHKVPSFVLDQCENQGGAEGPPRHSHFMLMGDEGQRACVSLKWRNVKIRHWKLQKDTEWDCAS